MIRHYGVRMELIMLQIPISIFDRVDHQTGNVGSAKKQRAVAALSRTRSIVRKALPEVIPEGNFRFSGTLPYRRQVMKMC